MSRALPTELMSAAAHEILQFSTAELRECAQSLSSGYRSREHIQHTLSPIERAAYLAVRFPSTYSVARHVWRQVFTRIDSNHLKSILDVGAGPGTASLALLELLASVEVTLLERDVGWKPIAQALALAVGSKPVLVPGSIEGSIASQRHDAVIACYVLNELPAVALTSAVETLWERSEQILIVIEPGTPLGFGVVRCVRDILLKNGGHVIAPCTHDLACPMQDQDWCHASLRLSRSEIHRQIKSAELSYEDEKFSFVAISRQPLEALALGRIVAKPIQAKGHIHLDICRDGAINRVTYSKKQGALYTAARDSSWGDLSPD